MRNVNTSYPSYILFLGVIFSENIMLESPAVSPAANRWQMGLLSALEKNGENIYTIGHLPEPLWPKGRLRINSSAGGVAPGINGELANYWNVPFVRSASLAAGYKRNFQTMCDTHGQPTCLISYNLYPHTIALARYARARFGIPWVCIVADAPAPNRQRDQHDKMLHEAAGRVFLSWKCFTDCRLQPKMHLDGGVNEMKTDSQVGNNPNDPKIVFFSGALNKWAGIDLLLHAFSLLKRDDVQLWICGKGAGENLMKALKADRRITYFGCVNELRLEELSRQATVMVNPRPSSLLENKYNFPSKVLEYLSYGKPVVSTWTGGLSPEYEEQLIIVRDETPQSFAMTLNTVLDWNEEKFRTIARTAILFLQNKKTWNIQALRLAEFIGNL